MNGCFRFFGVIRAVVALVGGVMLSQCALPPGTAWSVIRKDGVKDYFAISWGKKPVPEYVKELVPEAFGLPAREAEEGAEGEGESVEVAEADGFPEVPGEMPEDWARPVEPVFPLMETELPEVASGTGAPVGAQVVGVNPLLGGVMNDEFAEVDLPEAPVVAVEKEKEKGMAPGLKMKDPVVVAPTAEVVNHLAKGLSGEASQGGNAEPMVGPPFIPQGKVLAATDEVVPVVKEKGKDEAQVAKFLPNMVLGSVAEEVPFGLLVEGRPGFVRSPYAESHQIVDVSGLNVGAKVKCPFSGKFFKVPAAHAAMNERVKAVGPGGGVSADKLE